MRIKWWYIALFVVIILGIAIILHPSKLRTGMMFMESHKLDEAIADFQKAYEEDPNNPRVVSHLAMALEAKGRTDEAGKLFERLLELKPRDKNFKEVVRYFTWTEQPSKAMRTYEEWYKYRIENKKSFKTEQGQKILKELYAYSLLFQKYDQAIDILKTRREAFPDKLKETDIDLITLYEMTGNVEETVALLERILGSDSFNEYALQKFMEIAVLSHKEEVVEGYLVKNVEEKPEDPKNWQMLIDYQAGLKRYDKAEYWYKRWIASRPKDWDLKKQYVDWLIGHEQEGKAIAYLQTVMKEKPSDPYYQKTLVDLYEWNDMKPQLVGYYQQRFDANPYDKQNAEKLVYTLVDLNRNEEAERVLRELVAIHPDDVKYTEELASLYDAGNNSAAAISVLEKAVEKTDNVVLMKRLGEMYLWAGDRPVRNVEVKGP